jgi:Rps23 Pro-64 3,4-dihydroxylase Tpa1-like proline 4-hydroxylase
MTIKDDLFITQVEGIDFEKLIYSYPEEVWKAGGIAKSRYKTVKWLNKDTDLRSADSTEICNVLKKFLEETIDPIITNYADEKNINFNKKEYQLVRYKKGQFFKEHTDATEEYPRKISALLYLNDNYTGGEIVFTKKNISIKPIKNTLILFPSSEEFSHSAEPVISGIKYVVVGFRSHEHI